MKNSNLITKFFFAFAVAVLLVALHVPDSSAQTNLPAPRQETLLNGLKVLLWSDTAAKDVTVKIRIHSGSAFDPQGREGVMKLLSEDIFPNAAAREFFTDDLGGGLEIITNYDYIQVNASSRPAGFLTMLETLSSAVSDPQIDKETTTKLRDALLLKVKAMEADPTYVADRAAAKRLFGTFPYGRPEYGTAESLQKIDFADLLDAKKRFFTADNITVTITGNYDKALGLRAVRRYFGSWLKSDKRVPSTFRQPDDPELKLLQVNMPGLEKSYFRMAKNAPARNDKDYYPMQVYVALRREQRCPDAGKYQSALLRGIYISGDDRTIGSLPVYSGPCQLVLQKPDGGVVLPDIPQADFDRAKGAVAAGVQSQMSTPAGLAEFWLDADTYKLTSPEDEIRKAAGVTPADVKAFADRLISAPAARIVVTSSPKSN